MTVGLLRKVGFIQPRAERAKQAPDSQDWGPTVFASPCQAQRMMAHSGRSADAHRREVA